MEQKTQSPAVKQIAVFGGGCFWCVEAVFAGLKGVIATAPGYAGGGSDSPTYEDVSTGKTGHAEVVKIEFDPSRISYEDLLTVFFASHDPTTPNRQGSDIGPQYRSIILYTNEEQKEKAQNFIKKINSEGPNAVTEVMPLETFYEAEDHHKDYYAKNPDKPYCQLVINPKLKKVKERFAELLKQ